MPSLRDLLATEREIIADRLRKARKRKKMTQVELLQAMNCPGKNTISEWENGYKTPTLIYAAKAAKALGISLDELVEGIV